METTKWSIEQSTLLVWNVIHHDDMINVCESEEEVTIVAYEPDENPSSKRTRNTRRDVLQDGGSEPN